MASTSNRITYSDSGVSIEAGDAFVEAIKPAAQATARKGVMGAIGGFGALFDLKQTGYKDPVLVAGTDGVGTKLLGGIESGQLDTLGQDLVAMCVNDLICQGAEPLFFLDYFATGALDAEVGSRVVNGIAKACADCNCALIGGETAEMPQMYSAGHFDLAGFAVGAVERDAILPKLDQMQAGDHLIAWPSSGVHSNGFSLVRKVLETQGLDWTDPAPWAPGTTVADDLMNPTSLYVLQALAMRDQVKGFCHITGGGLPGNIGRVLPETLAAQFDPTSWTRPAFMQWIVDQDIVDLTEAYRVFNMGLGLVAVVSADTRLPDGAIRVGTLTERSGGAACIIGD